MLVLREGEGERRTIDDGDHAAQLWTRRGAVRAAEGRRRGEELGWGRGDGRVLVWVARLFGDEDAVGVCWFAWSV